MALDKDPEFLSGFIGRQVELETIAKVQHRGRCLSVDPVSGSLVLVSDRQLVLLPWVQLDKVQILDEDPSGEDDQEEFNEMKNLVENFDQFSAGPKIQLSDEELEERKSNLEAWLKLNHLTVSIVGNQIVIQEGLVTIDPPYRSTDCKATNEMVLLRVSNLLGKYQESKDDV